MYYHLVQGNGRYYLIINDLAVHDDFGIEV